MKKFSFVDTVEMRTKYNHTAGKEVTVIGLLLENEMVGYVEYHDDGDKELFIDMICIDREHQKKGYSNVLMERLVELHPEALAFTGESTDSAFEYWKAKGAIFHPNATLELVEHSIVDEMDDDEDLDDEIDFEDTLHPFCLKINSDSDYIPYWEAS